PLNATLTLPSTLRTARNISFSPMPVGSTREVLMNSLSTSVAFLDWPNLNDTSVILGDSGYECTSVLPLLKPCQSGSTFFHPVFQNLIHELTLM
ncbi:hypothetical protein HispidOSU_004700, partial [Sigmodon hispidus]